jgi:hypothetical protein
MATMASQMHPVPAASPTRQRAAAEIALALAFVYPLTVSFNAGTIQPEDLRRGGDFVLMSLYNGFVYIEWPLPIIAIFLATLVLNDSRGRNRIAWAAAVLGALSSLVIAGVITFLAFFAHGQSASSAM